MHEFPLTLKHRSDPHSSIVVANADQLAEVHDDFAPDEVRAARNGRAGSVGFAGAGSVGFATAEKSIESIGDRAAAVDAAQKKLDDSAQAIGIQHAQERDYIDTKMAEIKQREEALAQQDQKLQQDRAAFEASKVVDQPKDQPAEADKSKPAKAGK